MLLCSSNDNAHSPSLKKNVQMEPLEMTGCVIQTVTTPFCKLRTSNASECTRVKT